LLGVGRINPDSSDQRDRFLKQTQSGSPFLVFTNLMESYWGALHVSRRSGPDRLRFT
jgi:hypothetical protein